MPSDGRRHFKYSWSRGAPMHITLLQMEMFRWNWWITEHARRLTWFWVDEKCSQSTWATPRRRSIVPRAYHWTSAAEMWWDGRAGHQKCLAALRVCHALLPDSDVRIHSMCSNSSVAIVSIASPHQLWLQTRMASWVCQSFELHSHPLLERMGIRYGHGKRNMRRISPPGQWLSIAG